MKTKENSRNRIIAEVVKLYRKRGMSSFKANKEAKNDVEMFILKHEYDKVAKMREIVENS